MKIIEDLTEKQALIDQKLKELDQQKVAFENALRFAKIVRANIWNVEDVSTKINPTYTRYTKESILSYMQTPASNEKNIRNASIYMYDASTQYRRLIGYYGGLLTWSYMVSPLSYDPDKMKADALRKQYFKAITTLENMNLRHELQKASIIALREGIMYGVIWSSNNSFYIQPINADYCSVTSISDGCYIYSVDMSKIRENKLSLYPPEFTTMYNAYKNGGNKYQEVPENISFCLKADDTTNGYSIPPFASALPMLYDIETYKSLQVTATEISNYKMLGMQIPLNEDGSPQISWDMAEKYYQHLCNALPPYVGAALSPMKIESYDFDKNGGASDADAVSRAEEQFWSNTGTSALLHGSPESNTAGALALSIRTDEEVMFNIMTQAERVVNKYLKAISGSIKFKITFIRSTIYNQKELTTLYKEAATLGIPGSKSAYASILGITPGDILGVNMIELDILEMDKLIPLKSGYTSTGDESATGRPKLDNTDLTDEGAKSKDVGTNQNANR